MTREKAIKQLKDNRLLCINSEAEAFRKGFEDGLKWKPDDIKYGVCCPLCDNVECVRDTDKCEAEIWAKEQREERNKE